MALGDKPTVGVLSPLVGGFYFGGLLAGVSAGVRAVGGVVLAVQTFDAGVEFTEDSPPPTPSGTVAWDRVDGHVVVTAAMTTTDLVALVALGKPVVAISNPAEGVGCPVVMPDNRGGVRAAVLHLIGHGHRRIAFVGCMLHTDVQERLAAYRDTLVEGGLEFDPALVYAVDDANDSGGRRGGAAMIAAGLPSTAVVAGTDQNALGLMEALLHAGYSLPEDQAVVGFDDIEAGRQFRPALTTLKADFTDIGRFAGELLLRSISGEAIEATTHYVPTPLVIRGSCGCTPAEPGTPPPAQAGGNETQEQHRELDYFRDAFNTQYEVSMALLGDRAGDVNNLGWLQHTSVSAGLLGLWTQGQLAVSTAGDYALEGLDLPVPYGDLAIEAFPPVEIIEIARQQAGAAVVMVPARSAGHDWGWLCVATVLDYKAYVGRETINQWAALLTAALIVAAGRREVADLGRELSVILESSPDAIARYDADLRYRYVNQAAIASFGAAEGVVLGRTDTEVGCRGEAAGSWVQALQQVVSSVAPTQLDYAQTVEGETRWYQAQMTPLVEDDGVLVGVVSSSRDISELKRAEQALIHQALHDALTGLANRVLFLDRLALAIQRLERTPGVLAVLFIDLDHFKEINDSLGHEVGDRMLVEVARRLGLQSRRADTLSRFGGDEFVLLCDRLAEDEDVRIIGERLVRCLAEPFFDGDQEFSVSASIGIVVVTDPYADISGIMRNADEAMYSAKARGRDRFHVFDADLRDRATARHALEIDLRHAVARHELQLAYQPLFSLASGAIIGVEALLRWHHPVRGIVPPDEFISLAEQRGLIVEIGTWVIDESFRQLAEWGTRPELAGLGLAINVSSRQLAEPSIVDLLRDALDRHGLDPARITLEITETSLIEDGSSIRETLSGIRALGLLLALDDFGTGYSSLVHLRDFPVNTLKIDRSFVSRLGTGTRAREIIGALTAMAHYLDMTVVGEGIELQNEWDQLRDLGCDDGQGFLVSRPLPPAALAALMRTQADDRAAGPAGTSPAAPSPRQGRTRTIAT